MPSSWYILETDKSSRRAEGIETWRPHMQTWRMVDGRMYCGLEPILPGYVLVRSWCGDWVHIEVSLRAELLRFGNRCPCALGKEYLDWIGWCQGHSIILGTQRYEYGQRVAVKRDVRSSFAGMSGLYIARLVNWKNRLVAIIQFDLEGVREECVGVLYDHIEPDTSGSSRAVRARVARSGFPSGGIMSAWDESTLARMRREMFRTGKNSSRSSNSCAQRRS